MLFLTGVLLAIPILALVALALVTPVTFSGGLFLLGSVLIAVGLVLAPWQPRAPWMALCGLTLILAVAGVRLGLAQSEGSRLKVIVLPSAKGTRPVNVLVDERDSLMFGEALLNILGGVSSREHEGVVPALAAAYQETKAANGVFPSPILSTYLGMQGPVAFDAVLVEPGLEQTSTGVIFLHGFMGNVSIQCWQIAQAVEKIGAVTVCPSTGWVGDWWQPGGESILRATIAYLREQGIQRIYLGGFSNGGHGLGRLMSSLSNEPELSGLFFIAGASNAQGVRGTGLPVLVIQGTDDERMPVEAARQFVQEIGPRATYVELDADHFLIIKQPQPVREAIQGWLENQE